MIEHNRFFDDVPSRLGTFSLKWSKYENKDIIPLWVADMDFRSPPSVLKLASKICEDGIFGYGICPQGLQDIVVSRSFSQYNWEIDKNHLVWLPGMVCGLNVACRTFEDQSSQVITNTPVYPPFLSAPSNFGLQCTKIPLKLVNDRFTIDFQQLESLRTQKGDLFMLCHPHNPVGTCFTRKELEDFADFVLSRELFVCSDEIHCDLILNIDSKHIPFASINSEIENRTITLMAPSKTFNLPGFGCSYAVISNGDLRRKFKKSLCGIVPDPPAMGFRLAEEAYRNGESWRYDLIKYLRANRDLAISEIKNMEGLKPYSPEATYLLWIDANALSVKDPHFFFEECGVGLSNGSDFGAPGFLRLNLGCSRNLLKKALDRMHCAIAKL